MFVSRLFAAFLAVSVSIAPFVLPSAQAQGLGVFEPDMVWPLCGRIAEFPPPGWSLGMDCPIERAGDPTFHDAPMSSSFGPRQLASELFRYDFHRGIDLPADSGTPIFAVADGEVIKAGMVPSFNEPVIEIRHTRPGFASCAGGGGCYSSMYLHLSSVAISPNTTVSKGDYIGQTGTTASGTEVLHFEIRDAPPAEPTSSWQKESVHPLAALPYPDSATDNIELTIVDVDASDPMNPLVTARIRMPISIELDLESVEVEVFERLPDGSLSAVAQPGNLRVGNTIEGDGYALDPPFYSMDLTSRQYTYKDSTTTASYEDFLIGGPFESPYAATMPPAYDPATHLDAADPGDFQVGLFNGMRIAPEHYNASSSVYDVRFQFLELAGTNDPSTLCVKVRALDALGNPSPWQTHNCPQHSCPAVPLGDCYEGDRSSTQLKAKGGALDKLKFKLSGGPDTTIADFLDPAENELSLLSWCLWDSSAAPEAIVGTDVTTAGTCAGKPCWRAIKDRGFKFKDKSATPHGITGLLLLAGEGPRTKLKVRGKGSKLPADASLPLVPPLTAQLIIDDGLDSSCWQAQYSTPQRNDASQVKAKQ